MRLPQIPRWFRTATSAILVGCLAYWLDWNRLGELDALALVYILVGSIGTLFLMLFMALRWRLLLLHVSSQPLGLSQSYKCYLIGLFFNNLLPGTIGGDIYRLHYAMQQCQLTLRQSGAIILIERLSGLTALLILLAIGALMAGKELSEYGEILNHPGLFAILIIVCFGGILETCRRGKIPLFLSIQSLLLSLLAQGTDTLLSFMILTYFLADAELYWILIAMPLSIIVTLIPISLGGLGLRESTLAGVLALFAIDPSTAIIFSFMIYISKVLVGSVGGILHLTSKDHFSQST